MPPRLSGRKTAAGRSDRVPTLIGRDFGAVRDRRRRVVARNRQKILRGPAPSKPLLVQNGGHACVTAVSARRQAASREEVGKIMEGAVCFAPETGRGKTPRFGSDLFPPGKNPAMAAAETNRADDAQTTTPPPIRVPAAAAPVRAPTCPLFPSARKVRFGKRGQRSAYAAPASSHTPRRTSGCLRFLRCLFPALQLPAKATKGAARSARRPTPLGAAVVLRRSSASDAVPVLSTGSRLGRSLGRRGSLCVRPPAAPPFEAAAARRNAPHGRFVRPPAAHRPPVPPSGGGDGEKHHRFRLLKR